jgi:hypothetical protein
MVQKHHTEIVVEGSPAAGTPQAAAGLPGKPASESESVFLIPYPKIVFLYPTYLAAIASALYLWIAKAYEVDAAGVVVPTLAGQVVGFGFLVLMFLNLIVIAFDFPRTTSLTVFFFLVAVGIGLWMLFKLNPDLLPVVGDAIAAVKPVANATFYLAFAVFMTLMYVGVFVSARFDYWEVRPNELLHHHGVLSDLKRYSAPNLRIEKEINDIFEYFLLGAGRLILHPSNENRSIVLDNVFFINAKERKITRILSALQVRVNSGN